MINYFILTINQLVFYWYFKEKTDIDKLVWSERQVFSLTRGFF